jgi:hypothetical protein
MESKSQRANEPVIQWDNQVMSQQAMSQYSEPAVGGQGCEVVETEGEPGDQGEDQGWHQQPAGQ